MTEQALLNGECSWLSTTGRCSTIGSRTAIVVNPAFYIASIVLLSLLIDVRWLSSDEWTPISGCAVFATTIHKETQATDAKGIIAHNHTQNGVSYGSLWSTCRPEQTVQKDSVRGQCKPRIANCNESSSSMWRLLSRQLGHSLLQMEIEWTVSGHNWCEQEIGRKGT